MKCSALWGQVHKHCSKSFIFHDSVLADEQIINLHTILLTPGFHHIYASHIPHARAVLYKLLDSLSYYNDISCLTLDGLLLPPSVFDLHNYLVHGGYLDPHYRTDLEDFFLNNFEHDFLWVEATPELIKQGWFVYFEQKLIELHIDQKIPIIVLSNSLKKGPL